MAQIFHPSTNVLSKLSIVAVALGVPALGAGAYLFSQTYGAEMYIPKPQPIPFSHRHHVGDDGIDCRFCHSSVDKGPFAGMPSTHTCMTCHSQIWSDSPELEALRSSFRSGKPIQWARVHDLPDFVYFDHSIHVKKGVSCVSCHGRVDERPLAMKEQDLTMGWCIRCHRHPEKNIRPKEYVFNLAWKPNEEKGETQKELGEKLLETNKIMKASQLTNCSICHR